MSDNLDKRESHVHKNDSSQRSASKQSALNSALIFPLMVGGYSSYSSEVKDEEDDWA